MTRSAPRLEPYAYRRDPAVPAFDDSRPIIVFDGKCVMCSTFARFVRRRDSAGRMRLLAAQTLLGAALYDHFGLEHGNFETYVLLDRGRARLKSDAALRIFELLGLPWSLIDAGRIVPTFLRDALYDFVARNRIRWFGARDVCYAPEGRDAERFIQ